MTLNKLFALFFLVSIVSGCSQILGKRENNVVRLNQPHRVITHDFSEKYKLIQNTGPSDSFKNPDFEPVSDGNPLCVKDEKCPLSMVDIHFFSESSYFKDKEEGLRLIKKNIKSDKYLVIGYSHGKSGIGVKKLAQRRALSVGKALRESGVPKEDIFMASSWSNGTDNVALSKGVRVVGVPEILASYIPMLMKLSPVGE